MKKDEKGSKKMGKMCKCRESVQIDMEVCNILKQKKIL